MSLLPLVNAGLIGCCLVSILLWKLYSFFFFLSVIMYIVFGVFRSSLNNLTWYGYAFLMFLITEVLAFGTLFYCCLAYEPAQPFDKMTSVLELPFLGSVLLLSSSTAVTTYHHFYGERGSLIWLFLTIVFGLGFVGVQFMELWESDIFWNDSFYFSCCFSVVGLHFIHVVLGLLGLTYSFIVALLPGYFNTHNHGYYGILLAWYWHFVDYVWFYVFVVVYWF